MMKVSLLLLAVALICLQRVPALAVPVVEEEGLTMGRLSTNRRFLQSQYSQQNHSTAYSHHPSTAPSYHKNSTAQSHDTRHDKSTTTHAPFCRNNFQCASQTAYGQKKYNKGGCCNGRCVDLLSDDKNNCGSCERKCSYGAVCCKGQCKRIYGSDCENCGGCGKKCGKGVKCLYGICGYNAGSH